MGSTTTQHAIVDDSLELLMTTDSTHVGVECIRLRNKENKFVINLPLNDDGSFDQTKAKERFIKYHTTKLGFKHDPATGAFTHATGNGPVPKHMKV